MLPVFDLGGGPGGCFVDRTSGRSRGGEHGFQLLRQLLADLGFALRGDVERWKVRTNVEPPVDRHDVDSGGTKSRDLVERVEEFAPHAAAIAEHGAAVGGEPIEPAAPLARFFDPSPLDPPSLLEFVEQRIQGRGLKLEPSIGTLLDQLRNLVTVPLRTLEHGQDQELRAPFLQRPGRHLSWCHIGMKHTYRRCRAQPGCVHPNNKTRVDLTESSGF